MIPREMIPRLLRRVLLTSSIALVPLTAMAAQDEQPDPTTPTATQTPAEPKSFIGRWTSDWSGGMAIGLNGSSGNTDNFNVRAGVDGTRKTEHNDSRFAVAYTFGQTDSETSNNYFTSNLRNDWLLENSKWRPFGSTSLESDQFQDWRWRTGLYAGAGYGFIETDKTTFVGRVGAGARYDFTGDNQGWTPEGIVGLDLTHQINERQKLTLTADYYPSFDKFTDYRIESKAEWSLLVDPDTSLSLKIGVEDRYNSTPGDGFKKNDVDYFALLSWAY